jgi:RND family efflux transporter MFP subunit
MKNPFIFTLLALSGLLVSCDQKQDTPINSEVRRAPISVVEVREEQSYFVEQRFVGTVEARRTAELAFELSGTVEAVKFDEGEFVKAGSVVAVIDSRRLEIRRAELEAALDQAKANLELSRSTAQRDERLGESSAISELQVEQSKASLASSKAEVSRIEAQIESVVLDIEKSRLLAPFDGTVSKRLIDEGSVVAPGGSVLHLVESGELEVRAALADAAVENLSPGDELSVQISEGRVVSLTVARILPGRDNVTRSIDVILSVPDSVAAMLRDGDLVSVVSGRSIDAKGILLPRDALTESSRGLWACFVASGTTPAAGVGDAFTLDRRDVEVLHQYADFAYVRGGIGEGDWVMTAGIQKVAPGQSVTVADVLSSEREPALLGYKD